MPQPRELISVVVEPNKALESRGNIPEIRPNNKATSFPDDITRRPENDLPIKDTPADSPSEKEKLISAVCTLANQIDTKKGVKKIITKILENDRVIRGEQKDNLFKAVKKIQKKLIQSPEETSCQTFIDIAIFVFPNLKPKAQEEMTNLIGDTTLAINKTNHCLAADMCGRYLIETSKKDKKVRLQPEDELTSKKAYESRFLDQFFPLMTPREFNTYGQFLIYISDQGEIKQTPEELFKNHQDIFKSLFPQMSVSVIAGMTESFVEAGLVDKSSSGKINKLSSKADESSLTYDYLFQVTRAQKRIEKIHQIYSKIDHPQITTLEDISEVYDKYNASKPMVDLPFDLKSESLKTRHIAGIGLGHQDTDIDHIINLVKRIEKLPDDQKPQVIVLNNLLAGAFENRQKNLKPALVDGLKTMEAQFNAGRVLIDELQKTKIPICLNLGAPDWEIARDIVLRMLRYEFKLTGHVTYYQQDELQRLQQWSIYDKFVIDVALPYCLRKGEVLSAQDLLVLLDVHNKLTEAGMNGQEAIISDYERSIIDINSIPRPGKVDFGDGLYILDNFSLSAKGKDFSHRSVYLNDFNFSNSAQGPLYQEPLKSINARVIQGLASGKVNSGESFTILNQHEFIAHDANGDGTWVESMPSVQKDTFLENRGSRTRTIDASRRKATTRRRWFDVETPMVEIKSGRRIYHMLSEELNDLAESADRTTIVINGDEQIGSVTARPDLMAKAWDIAISKLKDNKVIWGTFGDENQGLNFKSKAQQEAAVGMQIGIPHQEFFYNTVLKLSFKPVSDTHMKNLLETLLSPGNHQLNSGFAQYGTTYMDSVAQTWNEIAKEKHSPLRARVSENVVTGNGSFYRGWVSNIKVGEYKGIAQHYPLSKGGKGSGGLTIYQAWPLLESMIEDAKDINFMHFQHYHHSMITKVAGKVVTIGPAKAGQSEFEHYLGCRSAPGMMMIHLGGGLPVAVEFLSLQALLDHKIDDESYFSDKNLKDLGFETDQGFNPRRDGFIPWVKPFDAETLLKGMPERHPQSALQKYLWQLATSIPLQVNTTIG